MQKEYLKYCEGFLRAAHMGEIDQEEIEYIANTYYKKSKQKFSKPSSKWV